MSFVLFDRAVELRIGQPADPLGVVMGLGRSWTDLRVEFSVTRTTGRKPNTASIKLYNPDQVSVGIIQATGAMVQLLAGYKPLPSLIFTGNVAKRGITVEKNGTERIVVIEAGDGELSYTNARFDWHFNAGTDNNTILASLIAAMGLGLGPGSPVLPPKVYNTDVTFFGSAVRALTELCSDVGADYSIQDGNLEILLGGLPTSELAVLLSPQTGLLGSPARTDDGINLTSLLNPLIKPGKPVSVTSRDFIGFVKPKVVKHTGDTRGSAWQTEVEAVPIE